jgi:tripartite-type tricarboxylate transporter receptor subunit TctC
MVASGMNKLRAVVALALCAFAAPAVAQTEVYPARDIKILVGFTAGGTTDVIARIVGQELSVRWGKPVIIDNRPGAGGNIAIDMVAKSKPDGYTIAIGSVGPLSVNATLYKDIIPYDNLKDLTPVTLIAGVPNMLVVNPNAVPVNTLQEFIEFAKGKPGAIFYGSTGNGTMAHLAGEMLAKRAGISMTHVPFKGATGVTDMLGGQSICCMFATIPSVISYVKTGRLKALGVTTEKRSASSNSGSPAMTDRRGSALWRRPARRAILSSSCRPRSRASSRAPISARSWSPWAPIRSATRRKSSARS